MLHCLGQQTHFLSPSQHTISILSYILLLAPTASVDARVEVARKFIDLREAVGHPEPSQSLAISSSATISTSADVIPQSSTTAPVEPTDTAKRVLQSRLEFQVGPTLTRYGNTLMSIFRFAAQVVSFEFV